MPERSPYVDLAVTDAMVGVVTTRAGDQRNAMTVSFASEVAHHPTALWVSIHRSTLTHELIQQSGRFTLALLHAGQRTLAWQLGSTSGRDADKCAGLLLEAQQESWLFLGPAATNTACEVERTIPVDDHTLILGRILFGSLDSRGRERRALLLSDL